MSTHKWAVSSTDGDSGGIVRTILIAEDKPNIVTLYLAEGKTEVRVGGVAMPGFWELYDPDGKRVATGNRYEVLWTPESPESRCNGVDTGCTGDPSCPVHIWVMEAS